jgi:hypothetical protein
MWMSDGLGGMANVGKMARRGKPKGDGLLKCKENNFLVRLKTKRSKKPSGRMILLCWIFGLKSDLMGRIWGLDGGGRGHMLIWVRNIEKPKLLLWIGQYSFWRQYRWIDEGKWMEKARISHKV